MKLQTKTSLLFTILTVSVFVALATFIYYFSNQFAHNDFYKRLELRARLAARFQFEKEDTTTQSFKLLQQQFLEKLPNEKSYVIVVNNALKPASSVPRGLSNHYIDDIIASNGNTVYHQDGILHYAGLLFRHKNGQHIVIESATNKYGAEVIGRLGTILVITMLLYVLLIYFVSIYFSRRAFKPFRNITQSVEAISEGNLQLRLPDPGGIDEVAELVQLSNKMLDRLQTAFESQNNFVSNASHELRTPLANIIAEADYALLKERDAPTYQQSLQQILLQAEKLQHVSKGLLALAQTSFDGRKHVQADVHLDKLLYDVKENVSELWPQNQVQIFLSFDESDSPVVVRGNEDQLRIAIGNVVLNACKYSYNAPVTVVLEKTESEAILKINDRGIGIPENEIAEIITPFFRASNTKGFEGHGIGIPLTYSIIRLHKGSFKVYSRVNEGTQVLIKIPLAPHETATF